MQTDLDLPLPTGIYSANSIFTLLVWQSHSFHQQILLTTKEMNDKDVYKWNQKNIFLHYNCLFIEKSCIHAWKQVPVLKGEKFAVTKECNQKLTVLHDYKINFITSTRW